MRSSPRGAPEERGGGAAADSVALMRPLVIVRLHEAVETALQRRPTREVAPAEGHAPMLLQNRALQSLDEAIGPRVTRFRPRVPEAQSATGVIERTLELGTAIGSTRRSRQPARR
jgi:hypothetical protein